MHRELLDELKVGQTNSQGDLIIRKPLTQKEDMRYAVLNKPRDAADKQQLDELHYKMDMPRLLMDFAEVYRDYQHRTN